MLLLSNSISITSTQFYHTRKVKKMTTTVSITQDLTVPVRQVIYSKVGDTSRYVEVTLFNDGVAWEVPSGATASVHAEQMDETYVESSTSTIDGNTITALLPTYTCEGTTPTEIAIMSGGQTVATFDFYVEVLKSA